MAGGLMPDDHPAGRDDPATGQPRSDIRQTFGIFRDVLLIGSLSIWGLYSGAGFLIPLAVAILTFVLINAVSDGIRALAGDRLAIPAWLANLIGVTLVLAGLFAVMLVLAGQARQLVRAIPRYEAHFDATAARMISFFGEQVTASLRDYVVSIDMSRVAMSAVGGAGSFLGTFTLICLYVAFMMAERSMLRQKIRIAAGNRDLADDIDQMTTAISTSLQRYVGVKAFISALTALFSYAVFRSLGLDFPETWAVLTFALNFIPSVGSLVAVIFPALVALVQFETITEFLLILFGCGTVQFLIGNFLDPALTGRTLNLSTLMVMLALTFWTAIWGIVGAFLSVPMTVCILIIFSHVPVMRPVAVLMSKDGRLDDGRGADPA